MPTELKKKGAPYPPEAIEFCERLFLKYGGRHYERIEQEMHRAGWAGFHRNLINGKRRTGKADTLGWKELYSWEKKLAIHLANKPTASLNNAQQLVQEVETVRKQLYSKVTAQGANVDKETLQLHRDYCGLSISALTKVEAAKDTLGAWVIFLEKLLDWAPDIDIKLAKLLARFAPAIIARAEEEFGETQEMLSQEAGAVTDDSENAAPNAGTAD
jgi:hypothetical protein